MPQTCKICRHEKRQEIDQALLDGGSLRNIAQQYATSPWALHRHRKTDIPATLVKAKQVEEVQDASTLFDRLRSLSNEAMEILKEARTSNNHALALSAVGRAEKLLELEAKLLGELDSSTKVAVGINVNLSESSHDQDERKRISGMSAEQLAQSALQLTNTVRRMAGLPPIVENKTIEGV